MLVIRFFRAGKRNQPFFKIVVTDKKNAPRGGRFVEEVGFFNPLTKEKNMKAERIKYWLSKGAKASDTVHNLLVKSKIIEGKKIPSHKIIKKSEESKLEEKPKEEKPAEEKLAEIPVSENILAKVEPETPPVAVQEQPKEAEKENKEENKEEIKKE